MMVTVLGCGSSSGVPMIGCDCAVCMSDNPKNKRSRVSVLIEINGKNLLIDTSPDLRIQALSQHINKVDAVLYTHDHADHTHGLDDLRSFNYLSDNPIPIYGDPKTLELLLERFRYAFKEKPPVWFRPCLVPNVLPDADTHTFKLFDTSVTLFKQQHGKITSLGYRIGNFAYSTDADGLPDSAFKALEGVEVWVVDCLRYTTSQTHSNLNMSLEWINRVKPTRAILTHMGHEFDYDTLKSELPSGVEPAYDGMQIQVK
jgi:phosphoribosyl 1,2-cyclic phosphate phosphodiesterase